MKAKPKNITIGTKNGDAELIERIYQYQNEKNIQYAADAVRELCEAALAIKKAIR